MALSHQKSPSGDDVPKVDAASSSASIHVLNRPRSDAEIVERLQEKDAYGAALLYDQYSSEVNRLVWKLLGADSEHDDIVQLVFCKLIDSTNKLRDPDKLRPYVLQVTVNTVRSELRKRSVRRRFFRAEEDPDRFSALTCDPEQRELIRLTFDVLEKLPLSERLAFTLRKIDGRSLAETAELCGCSLASIKRRLNKANRRFESLAVREPLLATRLSLGTRGGAR